MIKYDELYKIVESKVSKERFEHIKRVVERAEEYAKVYNQNIEEVRLSALAHDIAKNLPDEEVKKYYNVLDETEKLNKSLQHATIGAIMCTKYGFSKDMINAVKYHTTGRKNMSMLEKIVYLADATEKGRKIDKSYVDLVKNNIDEAVFKICQITIKGLLKNNKIIHVNSIECYNYYAIKCNV